MTYIVMMNVTKCLFSQISLAKSIDTYTAQYLAQAEIKCSYTLGMRNLILVHDLVYLSKNSLFVISNV